MTFSQAVEAAHSRGVTDFVRHREVGDLYERTNSMRPKLARSLDDAGRRERMSRHIDAPKTQILSTLHSEMLSEMNQKLSQAARLYDHLLTAHVSSPVSVQSPPVQQYTSPYYTPPTQQYVPPQPQQYVAPATSPPPPQPAQYTAYGMSTVPTYNSSGHELENAPSAPTPMPATQTYEQPASGPSTIQPQYYQAPAQAAPLPVQSTLHRAPMPTPTPLEAPPAPLPLAQHLSSPPVQAVASPSAPPPIQSQHQRSDTLTTKQPPHSQSLLLPTFPSVPNDPLPMPLVPQHIEQQPQKEAMLISFD